MVVHFFTKGNIKTPSSRQRAFLVSEHLNKLGLKSVVHYPSIEAISNTSWPRKSGLLIKTIKNIFSVRKGDVIYLQKAIFNKYFFVLVVLFSVLFRRKIIFDFDDTIFVHSRLKTIIMVFISDAVIVGSLYLKDWAERYNKNVYLIPTSVDYRKYSFFTKNTQDLDRVPVVGWIGQPSHYENLLILKPVFEKLISSSLKFKFLVVGSMNSKDIHYLFESIQGLEVDFIDSLDWGVAGVVPKAISSFDIGVMPLVFDEWNKGKCSFKAIEYMGVGIPTVATSIGENNRLIKNGENGFLAKTEEDWVHRLSNLIIDPKLRKNIGLEGQKTVAKGYSFEVNAPKIKKILESL